MCPKRSSDPEGSLPWWTLTVLWSWHRQPSGLHHLPPTIRKRKCPEWIFFSSNTSQMLWATMYIKTTLKYRQSYKIYCLAFSYPLQLSFQKYHCTMLRSKSIERTPWFPFSTQLLSNSPTFSSREYFFACILFGPFCFEERKSQLYRKRREAPVFF